MSTMLEKWNELLAQAVARASADAAFRRRLLADPRRALEDELSRRTGRQLRVPPGVEVVVLEDAPDRLHLVVPAVAPMAEGELTDEELDTITGGVTPHEYRALAMAVGWS